MFRKGQPLRCVSNGGGYFKLTMGKVYECLETCIEPCVRDDEGEIGKYFAYRFEPCRPTNEDRVKKRMEKLNAD